MHYKQYKYFFVGIGGIGMSAIAEYLKLENNIVAGCDLDKENFIIGFLESKEIEIIDDIENIVEDFLINFNPDFVIITNTVKLDHIALKYAIKNNIKIIGRAEMLGSICNSKNLIGITGSHGKTSTTGLMHHIFSWAKKNPTVFIGGIIQSIKNNFSKGNSEYYIVEADDAYKSFLTMTPNISIITSISYEHLETYKNWDDIFKTFLKYINNTKQNGKIIINTDDDTMKSFCKTINREFITYGLDLNSNNFSAQNIELLPFQSKYDLYIDQKFIKTINISIPGLHQVKNSLAVIASALFNNIEMEDILNALNNYSGVERRMQFIGYCNNNISVYDDYGHHPNELHAVFATITNMFKDKKIIIFFQPHKYTRTKNLWDEFISVFEQYKNNIEVFITDVYAAGDDYDDKYNSEVLAEEISKIGVSAKYIKFDKEFKNLYICLKNKLKNNINNDNSIVILTLGAGLMDRFAKQIIDCKTKL